MEKVEALKLRKHIVFKCRIASKLLIYKMFSKKTKLLNDEKYNKLIFFIMFGRKANFDNPRTFNEYICARKVKRDEYALWKYTDKFEVRKYVEDKIGKQFLNFCYGVFDSFDQIDFSKLPNQFALRGTHGSGCNIIVKDKTNFDFPRAKKRFDRWCQQNYYYIGREKNYYKIKPRIVCDQYLENHDKKGLPEMKVFCFNGKAKFISYNLFFDGKPRTNYYDAKWNLIDVKLGYEHFEMSCLPENKEQILAVAEKLAEPFDFVRVDLYDIDGERIIFSELTFHSGGGFLPFAPQCYDEKFGLYFKELENPV